MTQKELEIEIIIYKKMLSTIAKEYEIEDCIMSDYYFQARHELKKMAFLTSNQKQRLKERLEDLSRVLYKNYDWIEIRNEPIKHIRLGYTIEEYEEDCYERMIIKDRYDTITCQLVSFQDEVFKENVRYQIEDLLGI